MSPVVERIAQRVWDRLCPGEELLIGLNVACAITFVYAVGAHCTPLVVISFEPDFKQIAKAPVLSDVFGRDMAVIVNDRLRFCVALVQFPRGAVLQEKIIVNEWAHVCIPIWSLACESLYFFAVDAHVAE